MSKDFKMKKETKNINNKEDVTKYGEFVSSYFAWITPTLTMPIPNI